METLPNIEAVTPQEYKVRMLGSLGLYTAELDFYETTEHPEDDKWVEKSNN